MESESRSNEGDLGAEEGKKKKGKKKVNTLKLVFKKVKRNFAMHVRHLS